jgi:hypothetical protein
MKKIVLLLVISACVFTASAQKIVLLEQANKARTTKLYVGDRIIFRLAGDENYWYERTITEIIPDGNSLLLDNYLVRVQDIAALKVYRKKGTRILGGALLSLGISLGIATTAAALYRDDEQNYPALIGTSAGSFFAGRYLLKRKKIYMGEKYRLRIIEIKFEDIAPPKT